MYPTAEKIFEKLKRVSVRMPMVAALVPFVAGVLFFDRFSIPDIVVWAFCLMSCIAAALCSRRSVARSFICAALFMFGGAVWSLGRQPVNIPYGKTALMEIEIADVPSQRAEGAVSVPVRILSFDDGDGRLTSDCKAVLWSDGSVDMAFGDRITALTELRRFRSGNTSTYFNLMKRRGFAGTLFADGSDIISVEHGAGRRTLHRIAVERFSRLRLQPSTAAVAAAMGTGQRSGMTPELRDAYARSGVSHILAISGLHIGIVFLLANLLFRPLVLLRHGQIWARAAVLIPVWLYAAASGFSPSVVRAAVMFSLLQMSLVFSSYHFSLNTLAAAAFGMVAVNPDILFDVSFQLSFAAVTAIVAVGLPLCSAVENCSLFLRCLLSTFIIGAVAFVAATPLISHIFGRISPVGILINPLVILSAYVIVTVSVLWIAVPLPFWQPVAERLLDFTVDLQNRIVDKASACEWLSFDAKLSTATVIFIYLLLAAAMFLFDTRSKKPKNDYERGF